MHRASLTPEGRVWRIELRNYRNFEHLALNLKALNVLVGPNASGKTNFTEALITLQRGAEGKLAEWISSLGGFQNSVLHRFGEGSGFLSIALNVSPFQGISRSPRKEDLKNYIYEVRLASKGSEFYVSKETLGFVEPAEGHDEPFKFLDRDFGKAAAFRNPWKKGFDIVRQEDFRESELAISQVYDLEVYPVPSRLRDRLKSWRFYPGQWNLGAMRRPYMLSPEDTILSPDGSNLVNVLYNLWQSDVQEDLRNVLVWAYPKFEDLKFPPTAHGYVQILWKEKGLKPYPIAHLSNGTLRLLCVLAVLFQSGPSLVVLEEPEQGLHPYLATVIGEILAERYEYPGDTQWLITTHSPFVLDGIGPERAEAVLVFEDGEARVLPPEDLDRWKRNYSGESLGERFVSGEMGGIP